MPSRINYMEHRQILMLHGNGLDLSSMRELEELVKSHPRNQHQNRPLENLRIGNVPYFCSLI